MLLLVDGPNLAMRSIHAAQRIDMSVEGSNTAPLLLFANSLAKIIRDTEPRKIIMCWDSPVKGFRWKVFPAYKANRKTAVLNVDKNVIFQLVQTWIDYCGIDQRWKTEWEADDLISAFWAGSKDQITIASSDHDFLQLLGNNPQGCDTEIIRFSGGTAATDLWTYDRFIEEYNYEPQHYIDQACLAGDSSDNIPGVKGIGPKRAVKALKSHNWDWIATIEELAPEEAWNVGLYRELMDLRNPGAVLSSGGTTELVGPGVQGWKQLEAWLINYELEALVHKLKTNQFWKEPALPSLQHFSSSRAEE